MSANCMSSPPPPRLPLHIKQKIVGTALGFTVKDVNDAVTEIKKGVSSAKTSPSKASTTRSTRQRSRWSMFDVKDFSISVGYFGNDVSSCTVYVRKSVPIGDWSWPSDTPNSTHGYEMRFYLPTGDDLVPDNYRLDPAYSFALVLFDALYKWKDLHIDEKWDNLVDSINQAITAMGGKRRRASRPRAKNGVKGSMTKRSTTAPRRPTTRRVRVSR